MELDRGARKLRAYFAWLFKLVSPTPFGSSVKHTGCPRTINWNRFLLKRSLIQRSCSPLFLTIFQGEITPICVAPQITGQPVSRVYTLDYSRSRRAEFTVQVDLERAGFLVSSFWQENNRKSRVRRVWFPDRFQRGTWYFKVHGVFLCCAWTFGMLHIVCAIWGERCFACQSATFDRESKGPRLTYRNLQTTLCTVELPHKIGLDSLVRKGLCILTLRQRYYRNCANWNSCQGLHGARMFWDSITVISKTIDSSS